MTTLKHASTATADVRDTHAPQNPALARTGTAATLVATTAVTAIAAFAKAQGVDFAIGENHDVIPTVGVAVATGVLCTLGVVLSAAFRRWSSRPARAFVQTAVTLTAVSLVPPLFSGGETSTEASLILLHLLAAAIMIPALARALRP